MKKETGQYIGRTILFSSVLGSVAGGGLLITRAQEASVNTTGQSLAGVVYKLEQRTDTKATYPNGELEKPPRPDEVLASREITNVIRIDPAFKMYESQKGVQVGQTLAGFALITGAVSAAVFVGFRRT